MEEFKYLGTTRKNQNSSHEEIKSRLKSGNALYHSVQNLLSSSLLSENVTINIYRTIVLPVILYGSETWSLTLRKECRLRVSRDRNNYFTGSSTEKSLRKTSIKQQKNNLYK
jgi:hypothetical protein